MNNNWHDKAKWHYESALENYCKAHGTEEESLSEEEFDLITDFATTHIGLFGMWIVLHHFEGEIHCAPEEQNAIRLLERGKITGNDLIRTYCDSQVCEENISDEILEFVRNSSASAAESPHGFPMRFWNLSETPMIDTFTNMRNGWNTTGMACSISCHALGNSTVR